LTECVVRWWPFTVAYIVRLDTDRRHRPTPTPAVGLVCVSVGRVSPALSVVFSADVPPSVVVRRWGTVGVVC
jgi:hypothetical protein